MTRRSLYVLGRHTGHTSDAAFCASWAFAWPSVVALEAARIRRHAYLGRYWGISPTELEGMPSRVVRAYEREIDRIIRSENGEKTNAPELL